MNDHNLDVKPGDIVEWINDTIWLPYWDKFRIIINHDETGDDHMYIDDSGRICNVSFLAYKSSDWRILNA